ncbi:MAG: NAD-dependent succinate-semialdehyde dehydrogenase [Bacteroidia bacterium]
MDKSLIDQLSGLDWGFYIAGKMIIPEHANWDNILSPATEKPVGRIAQASAEDLNLAVAAASEAFSRWADISAWEREKIIRKATSYTRSQAEKIGGLMALEQGKPYAQSYSEIIASCDIIDYYAAEAIRLEGYTNPTEKTDLYSWVTWQPVGICGLITPWNYPVSLLSWKLGPALATGCTVVVKPTEVTPLSPLSFCMALTEGGIPPGVINVITGKGDMGSALVSHPAVAKIAMTGSTATGKKIMQTAAFHLKKVSLELGGHCPAIVCADADPDNAAEVIAYKGFRNMGQSCSSVNRVYVHHSLHDVLVAKLKEKALSLSIGDGTYEAKCDLGPMTTRAALDKVEAHVKDAIEKGATLICGGQRPAGEKYNQGFYYTPTLLTMVNKHMRVMNEETFGPVVPIDTFETLDEAIQKANDSEYGLCAYVFTRDFATTMKLSRKLDSGTVCVNNGAVNTAYGPYEGWKDSGVGVELSGKALFEYLKTKHIKIQSLP